MRAIRRDALPALHLRATGMEFASEMVIRAAKEEPSEIRQKSRSPTIGVAGSRSWRVSSDGWRHLRFLLVHSPNHLFILPGGLVAAVMGAVIQVTVLFHLGFLGRVWDITRWIAGELLTVVEEQVVALVRAEGMPASASMGRAGLFGSSAYGHATGSSMTERRKAQLRFGWEPTGSRGSVIDWICSRLRRLWDRTTPAVVAATFLDSRHPGVVPFLPAVEPIGLRRVVPSREDGDQRPTVNLPGLRLPVPLHRRRG